MNGKDCTFGIAMILFTVMFVLGGCQQPVETGRGPRDGAFEKDSLLIEVWDSSTPPQFLGYYTGLEYINNTTHSDFPIILTSKGYCVELRVSSGVRKIYYGKIAFWNAAIDYDEQNEIMKNNGWGCAIFFATANPTANDTPYASNGSNIVNYVMYNPHNGGTYYTPDRNATAPNITIQGDYKFYDNMGTMRTWNDDVSLGEFRQTISGEIGGPFYFIPLKKIGGYAELGLPDPATTTYPWVYKVK